MATMKGCTLFVQIAAFVIGVLAFVLEIYHGSLQRGVDYEVVFYFILVQFTLIVNVVSDYMHRDRISFRDNWLVLIHFICGLVAFSWLNVLQTMPWPLTSLQHNILTVLVLSNAALIAVCGVYSDSRGTSTVR